jgi:hypothetical protein
MGQFAPRFQADLATTPPDPQEVADAVARLIATPAGQRPLRMVVALEHQAAPTRALNEAAEQVETAYLDRLGVRELLTLARRRPTQRPTRPGGPHDSPPPAPAVVT